MKLPQIREASRQDVDRGPFGLCIFRLKLTLKRAYVKEHI